MDKTIIYVGTIIVTLLLTVCARQLYAQEFCAAHGLPTARVGLINSYCVRLYDGVEQVYPVAALEHAPVFKY